MKNFKIQYNNLTIKK